MAEHIEKNLLNTDLRYRFDYVSKFLNFTTDDIAALNSIAKILRPLIPIVVDTLYQKILSFDITKHYFLKSHDGFQGTTTIDETQLTLQSERLVFPRDSLRKYIDRILRQRVWNDAFLQYLSQIGKLHTNMTGSRSMNIDYIHVNLLLGYLEHTLINAISSHEQIDGTMKITALIALNKFFWIQNDFFTVHCISASKDAGLTGIVSKTTGEKTNCVCA